MNDITGVGISELLRMLMLRPPQGEGSIDAQQRQDTGGDNANDDQIEQRLHADSAEDPRQEGIKTVASLPGEP